MNPKKFKEIEIIESTYRRTLESEVNRLIELGYQPLDLSALNQKHVNNDITRIVMVKYEEDCGL